MYLDLILYLEEKKSRKQAKALEAFIFMFAHLRTFFPSLVKVQRKKENRENTMVEFYCHGQLKNVECEVLKSCIDQS